ncbi:MAG: hypothetical protein C5B54_06365, partial [Acidobacteria bacterium]
MIGVSILALFAGMALLYGRIIIQNDGITYYASTRSLVLDRNFDLTNESTYLNDLRVVHRGNQTVSVYSCGYAYLYAPWLWIFNKLDFFGSWKPYGQNAVIPFDQSFAIFAGSVLFGLICVFIGLKFAETNGVSPWRAFFIAVAAFIGTPLAFYTFVTPSFPHAVDSFLTAAAFVLIFLQFKGRNFLLGFVLGLSVMVRAVNIVFLPPMLLTLLYLEYKNEERSLLIVLAEVFIGALPAMVTLFHYNWTQYGSPFRTGYGTPSGVLPGLPRRLYLISIAPSLGIFIWTPITLLALFGLIAGSLKFKPAFLLALSSILLFCAFTVFFGLIYPGFTFGHRYFTHFYIFWVLGLSEMMKREYWKLIVAGTALAVLWTFLLFNTYFITFASPAARKALWEDP